MLMRCKNGCLYVYLEILHLVNWTNKIDDEEVDAKGSGNH